MGHGQTPFSAPRLRIGSAAACGGLSNSADGNISAHGMLRAHSKEDLQFF